MQVKLSDRLQMSANMVEQSAVVADVGCDHAHTCIRLLQTGIAGSCIGMDVRTGPLKKAEENLALYGCSDRVELRLGYGLDELKAGEADTIVVTGMGGELIRDILERDRSRERTLYACPPPVLVLQPQSHYQDVRSWLDANGFMILDEDMCREDDKFYPAIKAVFTAVGSTGAADADVTAGRMVNGLSPAELYFGPVLLKRRHPVLKEYLEIEYRKKRYMLEQIGRGSGEAALKKKEEVERVFGIICEAREILEQD